MEVLFAVLGIGLILYFFRDRLRKKILPPPEKYQSIDDRFNAERKNREIEIDSLLSKMGRNGLDDLSEKDRKRLNELSKK
ncbi:rhomboid family protein [Chryseobacterium sp.]|nr:rhomboid family protein [Chryseobacterium sp.]